MSYLQTIVIALTQGVTELFPVSSLGHSVIIPAWLGGSWNTLVTQSAQASSETSFYLAFIVALHVGTALALLWFFRADWIRIVAGFLRSLRRSAGERRLSILDSDERLAWLIVIATIPVGLTGLILEHTFRTLFAKPLAASLFLALNGVILLRGQGIARQAERARGGAARRAEHSARARAAPAIAVGPPDLDSEPAEIAAAASGGRSAEEVTAAYASDVRISRLPVSDSIRIGLLQILALFAGVSRDGVTMVGGLWRGLDREDAARFAFLLATPPILAAGVLKLPSLTGKAGAHIHGQIVVGFIITAITAYVSVRYLVRYFRAGRSLRPFAIYCLAAGLLSTIRFAAF